MICPDCMGVLAVATPVLAKCTTHGGIYRVLFQRGHGPAVAAPRAAAAAPLAAPFTASAASVAPAPAPAPAPVAAPAMGGAVACARHPTVAAELSCARCGTEVCNTCAFPRPDGSIHCPDCASGRMLGIVTRPSAPIHAACVRHPEVQAVERCSNCNGAVCETCDFTFNGLHFCPTCATNSSASSGTVSDRRKGLVIAAYAIAIVCTLGFFGSFVGVGVGFGAFEFRQANPWWVWVAAIWNSLILALFLLLMLIGVMVS